jgi:hypothetical protein
MLRVVYPTSGGRIKRELAVPRLVDATLVIYPFADLVPPIRQYEPFINGSLPLINIPPINEWRVH